MPAIEADGLVVRYGSVVAVDHLDLTVEAGEVVTLLGPNGAGKTSTVEVLEGYRPAGDGLIRVLGRDPRADHRVLSERIGVMLQRGGVYPGMSPIEALRLFAAYYDDAEDPEELLRRVGLAEAERTPWRRLSGGQQQRLSLALALVGRPSVAFLDEPTAGVDPEGRLTIRRVMTDLRSAGAAVLLTTHELEEAERLADRVVIIDHGRVVAAGTLAELRAQGGPTRPIRFRADPGLDLAGPGGLTAAVGAPVEEDSPGHYRLAVDAPSRLGAVAALTAWLAAAGVSLDELDVGGERLEDVYLRLTAASGTGGSGTERANAVQQSASAAMNRPGGASRAVGSRAARPLRLRLGPVRAQTAAEVRLTLRRGDSLLLALGIPVGLLVFFSLVQVLPLPPGTRHPVDFLAPGILSLAVMSTAMVSLGIATGFERQYGVLKRLGSTPLGRPALLAAKTAAMLAVEVVQVVVLVAVALALGWRPSGNPGLAVVGGLLASVAFAGLGLAMAGALRAEVTLAAANGLYLLLLLLGGMVFPLSKLPGVLGTVARALPASALSDVLHGTLSTAPVPGRAWIVLALWAVAAPTLAAATFRWE